MKFVTASEMREIDRRAIEEYGIPALILMENAGIRVFSAVNELLHGVAGRKISVFCGGGNNGGDGFVAARHLSNRGALPEVYAVVTGKMSEEAGTNFNIVKKMNIPVAEIASPDDVRGFERWLGDTSLVVDALLGTGLKSAVREPFCALIRLINSLGKPVVAVDVPSGLDSDTGKPLGACVRAHTTVTLGLAKKAFSADAAREYFGRLIVEDISIPRSLL